MVSLPDTERLHKNGQLIHVSITLSPIRNSLGEVIGASSIVRDIGRQKQAEQERLQLSQRLSTAKHQRLQALSGMLPICAACKAHPRRRGLLGAGGNLFVKAPRILCSRTVCARSVRKIMSGKLALRASRRNHPGRDQPDELT